MRPQDLAIEHLSLRLRPLNRVLRAAVQRQQRDAARFVRPGITAVCITDDHANALLQDVDSFAAEVKHKGNSNSLKLNEEEIRLENELRAKGKAERIELPFDVMSLSLALDSQEQNAVLICAAPEVEKSYSRIYGYVLDDLTRQQPCVELICNLVTENGPDRIACSTLLSRHGFLRRAEIIQGVGETSIERRQELRLHPTLLNYLLGFGSDPTCLFRDPNEVILDHNLNAPSDVPKETIERVAGYVTNGTIGVVGVWGARHTGKDELVMALAAASGLPLRRLNVVRLPGIDATRSIRESLHTASVLGAAVWVDTENLLTPETEFFSDALVNAIANSQVPVYFTGVHAWRPAAILESRAYTEFELLSPGFQARKTMWSRALPDIIDPRINDLAGRFRLSGTEMRAVAQVARTSAALNSNGHNVDVADELEAACTTVTRRRSAHFATCIQPRRKADDLVLPEDLHRQVMEIAHFFRSSALVDEEWGFGRMSTGGGLKVLFTGDPGTGKTLAAEVIAGSVGQRLLKVDLARVVSKWVGETERNLDIVFQEAEESHAVLFFDEADSLFGKRGEVQHGTDRFANLQVGFLLQRLEDHFGLCILASNLKESIDTAFTRRFHVIVHFPLPRIRERRRIWELAFPSKAPIASAIDLNMLQQLEMTGAAIMSAARTAALIAAFENNPISMEHVVKGISRQFQREARLLTPGMMGSYAHLLKSAL